MLTKLLSTPTAQLGRASRFLVFQIKLWSHCARLLKKNRAGQQAAALSYHTIFGIVPLTIVMLLIFQSLPAYRDVGEKLKTSAYEYLQLSVPYGSEPEYSQKTVVLAEIIDGIVKNFFEGVQKEKASITLVSVVIVIWAALALLSTVERAFNNIWHVGRGRSFLHRIINYWALVTLGPLLLALGIYIATQHATVGEIQREVTSKMGPIVLSYIISTVAFFLFYFVLPNTKVQARAAIWGAAVAALVWTFAKWGFRIYVVSFIPYSKVYGVLGLVPLSVLWIFITWLIVLFGLQLTFTTQHLRSLDAAEIAAAKRREEYFIANDLTVINIVREIAAAFEHNRAPVSGEVICSKLNVPAEFGDKILNHLVDSGLIAKTSDPRVGFTPVRDPANVKLSDISAIVAEVGLAQSTTERPQTLEQIAQSQRNVLGQYSLKQILDVEPVSGPQA
ncbi:MAG: YhjD/YihY/BrkB family envelope integrity protein [Planctomycetota bacterium]|jgi:YihY family inner membrane protein